MSGRKKIVLILAVAFVAAVVAVVLWPGEKEPEYQGRKLSEWLYIGHMAGPYTRSVDFVSAVDAVRHIGTNALPWLLESLVYEEKPPSRMLSRLPSQFTERIPGVRMRFMRNQRHATAIFGFRALADDARPAVPELTRLMCDTNGYRWDGAISALMWMGDAGLPALLQAATNKANPVVMRTQAMSEIGAMHHWYTNASWALPILFQSLAEEEPRVSEAAASSLGHFKSDVQTVAPRLMASMQSSNAAIRRSATSGLGRLGPDTPAIFDAVIRGLHDPDARVRAAAAGALENCTQNKHLAVDHLLATLRDDDDAKTRGMAARALGRLAAEPQRVVPALVDFLKDADIGVLEDAAWALREFGPTAQQAVPPLISMLSQTNFRARGSAESALRQIAPEVLTNGVAGNRVRGGNGK